LVGLAVYAIKPSKKTIATKIAAIVSFLAVYILPSCLSKPFLLKMSNVWKKEKELIECPSMVAEKLFGSADKVRIIKLFLFNPEKAYDVGETAMRAQVSPQVAKKEICDLEKAEMLKQVSYTKDIRKQKDRRVVIGRKRTTGWKIKEDFPYLEPLETFLTNINPFKHKDIIDKLSKVGKVQLLIISGLFIKYPDARVDLLVVGDNMKEKQLENMIHEIEAEIGREIRYAMFETSEFRYRQSMFDRLIRDILDYPHEKIINKLGL
jgi:hypothetical protein